MNRPSGSGSGSFEVLTVGNGSGTHFGASQCIPMGPCRLTLGVIIPLAMQKWVEHFANLCKILSENLSFFALLTLTLSLRAQCERDLTFGSLCFYRPETKFGAR